MLIFVPILLLCKSEPNIHKIFEIKKFTDNKTRLVPKAIKFHAPVYGVSSVVFPNKFVLNFSVCSLSTDFHISQKVIIPNFPSRSFDYFGSDDSAKIIWCYYRGSNLATLDVESKKTYEGTPVGCYDCISTVKLFNKSKHLLLIEMGEGYFKLFNILSGKTSKFIHGKPGTFVRYSDDKALFMEFDHDSNPTHWYWTYRNISMSDSIFPVLYEDPFTKFLTAHSLEVESRRTGSINFSYHKMLGFKIEGSGTSIIESEGLVTWDSCFSKPKISIFNDQLFKDYFFGLEFWQISPDGKWARVLAKPHVDEEGYTENEIFFFHIDDSYPLGISPPILGGTSPFYANGSFINHTELGPLYIDHDVRYPNYLFVYQLNKGLELLKKNIGETGSTANGSISTIPQ